MEHTGFQHQALIYEDAEEYLEGAVPYLQAGLDAGQRILVAVGPAQTELLKGEFDAAAEAIEFADMREVGRNPASIIPLWRDFVDESGGAPVRGIGEPVWAARTPAALGECQRHESLLNLAFDGGPAWDLLCPYDAATLGEEILDLVGHSHPRVCRHGRSEPSPSFVREPDWFGGGLAPPAATPTTLSFGIGGLGEVRRLVAAAAERAGMDARETADLVIATSELAANSVMHGGGVGTLRLWQEDGRLLAEVEDRGCIEEPLVGRIRPPIDQEGGRGLWLANQLCDLVQIRSGGGGTVVRLHILDAEAAFV
ncbi:MAG TPA: sensor histidine kinase [Solirubrobacterales bacterium]|nr:sensor histidine kinase [Solirubrobacterales bacterium]